MAIPTVKGKLQSTLFFGPALCISSTGWSPQAMRYVAGSVVPINARVILCPHITGELRGFERFFRANTTFFWGGDWGGVGCIDACMYMLTARLLNATPAVDRAT